MAATAIPPKGRVLDQPVPPVKTEIKTVLVAECGWPTDAMQPARKQVAKRR